MASLLFFSGSDHSSPIRSTFDSDVLSVWMNGVNRYRLFWTVIV